MKYFDFVYRLIWLLLLPKVLLAALLLIVHEQALHTVLRLLHKVVAWVGGLLQYRCCCCGCVS